MKFDEELESGEFLWATQDWHRQGGGFPEREKEEPHPKRLSVKARQLVDWRLENYFSQ